MKSKKYLIIFLCYLIWILAGFITESEWMDIVFASISSLFLVLIIFDLVKKKLVFRVPGIPVLIIDILALSTMLSGTIVTIDYGNLFVYLFAICGLIFIFTEKRELKE